MLDKLRPLSALQLDCILPPAFLSFALFVLIGVFLGTRKVRGKHIDYFALHCTFIFIAWLSGHHPFVHGLFSLQNGRCVFTAYILHIYCIFTFLICRNSDSAQTLRKMNKNSGSADKHVTLKCLYQPV